MIALRTRATPKEAIIITRGDASFLRKPRYTSLSIMIPARPVSTNAATSVQRRTDHASVPSRGASYIGKKYSDQTITIERYMPSMKSSLWAKLP